MTKEEALADLQKQADAFRLWSDSFEEALDDWQRQPHLEQRLHEAYSLALRCHGAITGLYAVLPALLQSDGGNDAGTD